MVACAEAIKLVASAILHGFGLLYQRLSTSGAVVADEPEQQGLWHGALGVALAMSPVAAIYTSNNLLTFYVLAHVRMDAYAVWRNLSILFNAMIWVWALQRPIERHRWVAVGVCLLGSVFNTVEPDGRIVVDLALSGVLLSAFLSSLACVFNERVIKSKEAATLDINQVNMLLYCETLGCLSLIFLVRRFAFSDASLSLAVVAAIKPGAWRIISLQVAMGLSVSRILKYADSMAKTIVGSLRDVAIVVIAPYVVTATRNDNVAVGSACLVGLAGLIYAVPAAVVASAPPAAGLEAGQGPEKSSDVSARKLRSPVVPARVV